MEANNVFIEAVKAGEAARVYQLLDEDPSLANAQGESGASAVLLAVYYGHPQIADLLIGRGAELDLFEAAATGRLERVRELLEGEPELVNAFAEDGFQPLGLAAFFGHAPVADYLLDRGAEVNTPSNNPQKVMPLHSAVAGRHYEIARALLEHGADVNAPQQRGFTPLHGAAQNGQLEMVQLLLDHGADPQARSEDERSALDFAQEKGHNEIVLYLRERGA